MWYKFWIVSSAGHKQEDWRWFDYTPQDIDLKLAWEDLYDNRSGTGGWSKSVPTGIVRDGLLRVYRLQVKRYQAMIDSLGG